MIFEKARYLLCGDRYVVVECGDEGSIEMTCRVLGMKTLIERRGIPGVLEVPPGSASLMVEYDPKVTHVRDVIREIRACEQESRGQNISIDSRIITMPVWYNDTQTQACAEAFGVRNNVEWTAEINGMGVEEFIVAHAAQTYLVTSIGFSPGCPAFLSMDPDRELVGMKYRPRTWTPRGTLGLGGNSGLFYSMRGPGGVSMLGIAPLPLYDTDQRNPVFRENPILFKPGDRIRIVRIDEDAFERISREADEYPYPVEKGETLSVTM